MTKAHIKEALSTRSVEALANYMGFATESQRKDYGIDWTIREIFKCIELSHSIPILISMLQRIEEETSHQQMFFSPKTIILSKNHNDDIRSKKIGTDTAIGGGGKTFGIRHGRTGLADRCI